MTDEQISRLDHFEKAQLYHNVYYNSSWASLPIALRPYYTADDGLAIVKATIANASIKDPYEIAKLIKAINPSKPQTLQEVYARAAYLANLCDTSVEKILRSDIFNTRDFIPDLTETAIKTTLANKTTGMLVPLKASDYTPSQDDDEGGDTPTPVPGGDSDYADENKIYFTVENESVVCDTAFDDVISKIPKLPAAELVLDTINDSQNILNISCGYNESANRIDFNFIRIYQDSLELFTIHYARSGITIESNSVVISGGTTTM